MMKGNKGEWSEFYTFLKILDERKLFFADSKLNKLESKYFPVINLIREEAGENKKIYNLLDEKKIEITNSDGLVINIIDTSKLKLSVNKILEKIKSSSGSFAIEEAENLIKDLKCSQIKAGNSEKADISLSVKEYMSPMVVEMGFSVKSMLGGAATLLNASGSTNFIYKIVGFNGSMEEINSINTGSKVRDRIKAVEDAGGKIIFDSLVSERLKSNLKKIDVAFSEILASAIKNFYQGKGNTIEENCDLLINDKELREKYDFDENDFKFKIKSFLRAVALGMVPNKTWDGLNSAHGGYLIVKKNGEVVCYHLFNLDAFQDYLFKNTKFETPSTTRHDFGLIYEKGGNFYINLNLQIRFLE